MQSVRPKDCDVLMLPEQGTAWRAVFDCEKPFRQLLG
jgi:hypothetical protein